MSNLQTYYFKLDFRKWHIKFVEFKLVKVAPEGGKSTDRDQNWTVLNVVYIHQHAEIQAIPPMRSQEHTRKHLGTNARTTRKHVSST